MHGLMTLIVMGVNFGISWWNARQAGRSWLEAKALGGFVWVVTLCAAIQSALGFTTVICFVLAVLAKSTGLLSDSGYQAVAALDYLLVIIPLIGSGLILTLASWRIAFREKSLASMGTTAYNTLAMAYDIASAAKNIPSLIDSLKFLGSSRDDKKDDDDSGMGLKVVLLVLAALVLGILLTVWIIRTNIRKASLGQVVRATPPQGVPAVIPAAPTQPPPVTSRQQETPARVSQNSAPMTPSAPVPPAPSLPVGKRSVRKGAWVLSIVVVVCATTALLGYLYHHSHVSDDVNGYYVGSPADNSPAGSDTTSALSGALGDSGDKTYGSGSPASSEPAAQAAQMQPQVQAPSQQAMQQAVQQDTAAQAQGGPAGVTINTYGNVVASFYPGKSPLDAIDNALVSIHSELTVMDMAPSGYPEYQVECESNGQCVGGTGTPMGDAANVAKEMFPVNPADVGQGGITCGQYICNDGKGNVIGRNPSLQ